MPFTLENARASLIRHVFPRKNPVLLLAEQIEEELKDPANAGKYPFDRILYCNNKNPQVLGQKPIRFINEVLALCQNPKLMDEHPEIFRPEVIKRARELIQSTGNSGVGAYTGSQGLTTVLKDVVNYITERDGLPEGYINQSDVFLSDGSSAGIKMCLQMFLNSKNPKNTGYLIPSPQCNIFRHFLNSMGSLTLPYDLNEDAGWDVSMDQIEKVYYLSRSSGTHIPAIVVINPGSPTGGLVTKEKIRTLINFAVENDIMIFADETLQNAVGGKFGSFISFQKVAYEMEQENPDFKPQIISFSSISKGIIAYPGIRAGYFVLHNFSNDVRSVFVKMVSINLCPNTIGQLLVSLGLRGATKGTAEEAEYQQQKEENRDKLEKAMELAYIKLNYAKGFVCQPIKAGCYAFPRITVPRAAAEQAKKEGLTPSEFYTKCLLLETGILVVPGSSYMVGFGREYVRISLLYDESLFSETIDKIISFNDAWLAKYK